VKALTFIEIDVDYCSLTYGTAPCTASLGVTGADRCYNTINTCQARAAFANAPVTLRFAIDTLALPESGIEALPYLTGFDYTSPTISLGQDLGTRASLSANFMDRPHPDTGAGFDKYLSLRAYDDPFIRGTFFGRFATRQKYLKGRPMRLIQGYVGQTLAEMETHHFLIENFTGPDRQGIYRITAKDALKLADGDRAQAPALSIGYLTNDITNSQTTIPISPAGIAISGYQPGGYLAIGGKEIVSYNRNISGGNDANALLLLHIDGPNNTSTFTDSSASARTISRVNSAYITTSQSKFGGSSMSNVGDSYLTVPDSIDWTFSGNFTVDCWIRISSNPSGFGICGHGTSGPANGYGLRVTSTGALQFAVYNAGATLVSLSSATSEFAINTWYHVAIQRSGNVFTLWKNGIQVATATATVTIPNVATTFRVGQAIVFTASPTFNGFIDEFRVSNVARYSGIFTTEVIEYISPNDLQIVRSQYNTTAQAHDGEDRVQQCLVYTGQSPADVLYDLFTTYAGVPAAYINLADWQDEIDQFYRRLISAFLADAEAVKKLASEIIEQCGLAIWWDDEAQKIRLQVLREIETNTTLIDESSILEGTFKIQDQAEKRISQVWNYYGQINPLKSVEDADNYRSTLVTIDAQSEADYGQAAIKKIYSRWIPELGQSVAARVNNLQLGRFLIPPRRFNVSLFRTDDGSAIIPEIGNGYTIAAQPIQDASGAAAIAKAQITRLTPRPDRFDLEFEEVLFSVLDSEDLEGRTLVAASDTTNINIRTSHDLIYPAPVIGDTVTLIVYSGIKVGGSTASIPAITVGSWPTRVQTGNITSGSAVITSISVDTAGLTAGMGITGTGIPAGARILSVNSSSQITLTANATATTTGVSLTIGIVIVKIIVRGSILGAGGLGGTGANGSGDIAATAGQQGGTGLYTRYPTDLQFESGAIKGGGGGGGGGACRDPNDHRGGGGGGGAGFNVGGGGTGPGNGEEGQAGTLTAGGAGGRSYTSWWAWEGPSLRSEWKGGNGGAPGAAGTRGRSDLDLTSAVGGAGGYAVDGISYVNVVSGVASYAGSTVN
jgi:hypothetical protein